MLRRALLLAAAVRALAGNETTLTAVQAAPAVPAVVTAAIPAAVAPSGIPAPPTAAMPMVQLFQPQANAVPPTTSIAAYKTLLKRIIAVKRWRMAYFYIYSTRLSAYVAAIPEEGASEDMTKMKTWMSKSAVFFDLLANYEISGFIYCVLLLQWASPPPTDAMGVVEMYQTYKTVYTFFTWQHFLIWKDYMVLLPQAFDKLDPKMKAFVDIAETYSCWHAFNEWHVAKMMGVVSLTEQLSPASQAKLASFWWDETFIKTVHTLVALKLWSWSYPEATWLTKSQPWIALSLPWIAFVESYWEWTIAGIEAKKAAAESAAASVVQVA